MLGLCEIFKNKSRVAEQRWLKSLIWCHLEAKNFDKKKVDKDWLQWLCLGHITCINLYRIRYWTNCTTTIHISHRDEWVMNRYGNINGL